MENLYKKILVLSSLISALGAIVYKLYSLNNIGITITLILSALLFFVFIKFKLLNTFLKDEKYTFKPLYSFIYVVFFTSCYVILLKSGTNESITSPWQVVPWNFFLLYFLATLNLIIIFLRKARFSSFFLLLHSFLSFSIIWTIYRIGYGYDPFIHEASMELIKSNGSIDPKPIYYLGQYSLVIISSKILSLSIVNISKILIPLSSAFLAVPAIYIFIKEESNNKTNSLFTTLLLLTLPFSFATFTTPQNLSYIFLVITIFYSLILPKKKLAIAYLLAITTFLIHPVSGLPAIFFVSALHAYHLKNIIIKKIGIFLAFIATAISLPASFYLVNKNNSSSNPEITKSILDIRPIIFPNSENIFLNFIQFFTANMSWLITIIFITTVIFVWKKRNRNKKLLISTSLSIALLFSYFLTKSLSFGFLIDYERSDYPLRILTLAVIMILPATTMLFLNISNKILKQKNNIKYPIIIFITIIITSSLYASYPRKDNYLDSHGLSVSAQDIQAVSWIENDAKGKPYVVLANQQVSVAALRTIGFRYLENGQFFYPIPTGGELYKYYLEMVYEEANNEPILKAMEFSNTNTAYFVLNKYWYAFDKILKEAKLSTDTHINIDNELYIFKYERKQ